jgi:hypothetical protein
MSAALLAPHDPEPYHGGDALHAPEWCQQRLVAPCADCRREIVCCTVSRPEIAAMLDLTWRCPDCRSGVYVARATGIVVIAALFGVGLIVAGAFLWLMHLVATGRLPW